MGELDSYEYLLITAFTILKEMIKRLFRGLSGEYLI
jgi:hypothetical protein